MPEFTEAVTRGRAEVERVNAHEHVTSLEREIGYHLIEERLDYFCTDCLKLVHSVPYADLNDEELYRLGLLAGDTLGKWGDPPEVSRA